MIKIYGKTLEQEEVTNLVQEMQNRGIEHNSITYSTIISLYGVSQDDWIDLQSYFRS
ncbi:hypothetical protein SLEP1_g10249 [Rubroshorea leprosula]|uniref:Uncharacterized protein n=1 Tax=Rubroshorea leprosula TaxID=152421 RepID=A0AAV5ID66_9ROSI|nr:hypothetical protein SLEP1_g10249 [Rubroshorea leprosula]